MRLSTHTVHQFFEFIIFAAPWGYRVSEYRDEHIAGNEVNHRLKFDPAYHVVDDWQQFIDQSPCHIPPCVVDCIVAFYQR